MNNKRLERMETKIVNALGDEMMAPYEVAEKLRLKRKSQLLLLKDAINSLYAQDDIEAITVNNVKMLYLK